MMRGERVANPDGTSPWWYPYPFLDPHIAGGYGSPFTYIAVMTGAFLAIGAVIIAIGRYRERRATRHAEAPAAGALRSDAQKTARRVAGARRPRHPVVCSSSARAAPAALILRPVRETGAPGGPN